MRRSFLAVAVLLVSVCGHGTDLALPPPAATAAAPGPFPAQFTAMVRLSLQRDTFYGSQLLQSLDQRVTAVAAMRTPEQVRQYLTEAATAGIDGGHALQRLKLQLASTSIEPSRASALLLAHALARPSEFGATLDGLEDAKPGLGKTAARVLSIADGPGDRRLLAALRAAGARSPQATGSIYTSDGRLKALFDGSPRGITDAGAAAAPAPVDAQGYTGYGPDGKPRRSGLVPATRP